MGDFKDIEDFFNGDFENIDFSFLDEDDLKQERDKQKEIDDSLDLIIDMLAEINPDKKVYLYAKKSFSFTHKVSSLLHQKYDNQTYEELTNMIEQFDRILNDYLKEKGLKYEE